MGMPIDFKGSNLELTVCDEHAKQGVMPMKAAYTIYPNGQKAILECWKLNWLERLSVLFFGRVWLSLWVTPDHVPPVSIVGTYNMNRKL